MSDVPLGYTFAAPPETVKDTYRLSVADRAVTTTKSAIQKYIMDFLSPKGQYRQYLEATSSPQGLQFVTELTYDEEMKASPNKRRIYLARFFAENTGRLPSVLLIDQGLEYVSPGITSLVSGFQIGDKFRSNVSFFCHINLSVLVASLSQEDTDTLGTLMLSIFGTLPDVVNNHIISAPGERWEVRIPLVLQAGQISNIPVENDPKTQVWTRSLEMALDYETIIPIEEKVRAYMPPMQEFHNQTNIPPIVRNLVPNQKIPLGSSYPLIIDYLRFEYSVGTSDPRIATVTTEQPFLLQPRGQGQALLLIRDRRIAANELTHQNMKNPQLLLEIPFEVTR
jgi:hypothetical protein